MLIEEVERILGITKQTVYMHVRRKNLNPVKIQGRWDFDGQEVYAYLMKRKASSARHSASNAAPKNIAANREYSAKHIWQLVQKLERFKLRYERHSHFVPIFELKDLLLAVFIDSPNDDDPINGRQFEELLLYLEMREESTPAEEKDVWRKFRESIEEAFLETNDEFNRNDYFEDLLLDAAIELESRKF